MQVGRACRFVDHCAVEVDDPAWPVEVVLGVTGPVEMCREIDDAAGRAREQVQVLGYRAGL